MKSTSIDLSSFFHLETLEIIDRLKVLLKQETQPHYRCHDYLRVLKRRPTIHDPFRNDRLEPSSRSKIVRWLYDIVDYFSLQRETVIVAMTFVDRFMGTRSSDASAARRDVTIFQLIAVACLSIAMKSFDCVHIDVKMLVCASWGCYTVEEIVDMENKVLRYLDWRLNGPTSMSIAQHLIALLHDVIPHYDNDVFTSLVDFTCLQIELAVTEYSVSVLRSPSMVALASVHNSMDLLDFTYQDKRAFNRVVGEIAPFLQSKETKATLDELIEIFDRQSEDLTSRVSVAERKVKEFPPLKQVSFCSSSSPMCVNTEIAK